MLPQAVRQPDKQQLKTHRKRQENSDSWRPLKARRSCDTPAMQVHSPEVPSTRRLLLALAFAWLVLAGLGAAADAARAGRRTRRQAAGQDQPTLAPGEPESTSTSSAGTQAPAESSTRAPKAKIPPINFTQVDQLFNAPHDERQVELKWRHMDKQITDGVRSILKTVFPHAVAMSTDAKVSGACSGAILKWILNLRNLRSWAVKMLDATGKPAAGLLEGSLTMFGNYHECLSVRAPDEDEIELVDEFREYFRGQYCVLQVKPYLPAKKPFYSLNSTIDGLLRKSYKYYENNVYDDLAELAMAFNFVNIRADLCVPSLCSRDDIQRVADYCKYKSSI